MAAKLVLPHQPSQSESGWIASLEHEGLSSQAQSSYCTPPSQAAISHILVPSCRQWHPAAVVIFVLSYAQYPYKGSHTCLHGCRKDGQLAAMQMLLLWAQDHCAGCSELACL
eukprot:1159361-Pelagomonas_calceolata.AAC.2